MRRKIIIILFTMLLITGLGFVLYYMQQGEKFSSEGISEIKFVYSGEKVITRQEDISKIIDYLNSIHYIPIFSRVKGYDCNIRIIYNSDNKREQKNIWFVSFAMHKDGKYYWASKSILNKLKKLYDEMDYPETK